MRSSIARNARERIGGQTNAARRQGWPRAIGHAATFEQLEKRTLLATVLYRVNAGGPAVSDTPIAWGSDHPTPSIYTNATESGSEVKQPAVTVDPGTTGAPASVFTSYRFDRKGVPMRWSFPVSETGLYELKLYFADTYVGTQGNNLRVFDVKTEGQVALDNYDIYADVGGFKGAVKTLMVNVTDGALDVEFNNVIENPLICAIQVAKTSQAGQLQATPGSLNFGTINTGGNSQQNITLTNMGQAGDQAIVVTSVAIEGAGAGAFTHNLTTPVSINPGASTQVTVTFAPTAATSHSAELVLNHNGVSSPLQIALSGAGQNTAPTNTAPVVNAGADQAISLSSSASLSGQVSDDGLPVGSTVTTLWSKVSGPGTVTFANAASLTTSVSFSQAGTYVLQLTASDGQLSGSDQMQVSVSAPGTIGFGKSTLAGALPNRPTSLQFGPDGRLYVASQTGQILMYTVTRNGPNDYAVTNTQATNLIQTIPNHNDDGTVIGGSSRMVTGILVVGTATNPVIYALSSDPRIGGGESGEDLNLDTNSGVLSRLTWTGTQWVKLDLVRGLPRSEENHHGNGLALDAATNTLFIAYGGNTNMGATSNNFAFLAESALSAAILSVDLDAIGNSTYDMPTLDDEDRPGTVDAHDPFGGNNGKNQAIIVPGGPVQVYSPGYRNPYDVIISSTGKMYTIDNGSNAGWGNVPLDSSGNPTTPATAGDATNVPHEAGPSKPDQLHYITGPGFYGGHPNPTRANRANTFNPSNPQSPVPVANSIEGYYRQPGAEDGALALFPTSTNGLTEYTSSHFGGAMQRDLLTVSFDNTLSRLKLNAAGDAVVLQEVLFNNVGSIPLDVTTVGDTHPFHGTIWVCDWLAEKIIVFEPSTGSGTGADDPNLDEDFDGYDNHDEIANGTNPLSAGDFPADWDEDFESDLLDPDDDNDTTPDVSDPFAIDPNNGRATQLPVSYLWENEGTPAGGLLDMGFTGLMTNGSANYKNQFDPNKMTAGGAAGVLTVDEVSEGDAAGSNDQEYGLQFGVDVDASSPTFMTHTRVLAPFAGLTPQVGQSMGFFIGTGSQDNYLKLVIAGDSGGQLKLMKEVNGVLTNVASQNQSLSGVDHIDLYLIVDPATLTVRGRYSATIGGTTGAVVEIGSTSIPLSWLSNAQFGMAVGLISTSKGPAPEFAATWDFMEVTEVAPNTLWLSRSQANFGPVFVGQQGLLNVTLRNQGGPGDPPISINSLVLGGDGAAAFELVSPPALPLILGPGQSTNLAIRFTAGATGTKQASLTIGHSGNGGSVSLPLSGVGVVSGLLGEYYDTHLLTDLKTTRIDQQINFSDANGWSSAPPGTSVTPDSRYSERWTGFVKIDSAGTWTFATNSNDGVRLWVNDVQLVNNWTQHSATLNSGTIALQPGWYPIKLEHYQQDGKVAIQLFFSGPGQSNVIIPSTHLATGGSAPQASPMQLGASVQDLNFGEIAPGGSKTLALTLTHLGAAGDANIVIDATTISGANAVAFGDSFNDAGNVTLSPGQSTTIQVTFSSSDLGAKSAQLSVHHSGANSPLTIGLSGSVVTAPSAGWTTLPSLPYDMAEIASGVINGKLIVLGQGSVRTVVYDISAGTWAAKARRPYDGKDHVGQVVGSKFYVFGGTLTISGVKTIWDKTQIYDPANNTWTEGAPMPFGSLAASVAVINGEIYLAGGVVFDGQGNETTTNRLVKYNPTTNTWTELAPMPQGRNSAATGSDGSRMYVFGGRVGGDNVSDGFNTVQIYNPATNTWISSLDSSGPGASLAPLPLGRGGIVLAPYYNGEFYVMGGETSSGAGDNGQGVYSRVDIYNPATNTWRSGPPMPTARHGISPVLFGNTIYVAGGGVKRGTSTSTKFEALTLASADQSAASTSATVFSRATILDGLADADDDDSVLLELLA